MKTQSNSRNAQNDALRHFDELCRGVTIITPPEGLKEKLIIAHKEQRRLVVKLGFDPTAPDLHLGHAVVLRKMRQFQDAGHKLVIIIGDFTARIGDPTGRNKARPPLSAEEVQANARTYVNQLSKVIDVDDIDIRFNATWLGSMNFADVVQLLSKMTVAQLLQREDFNNRYTTGAPISLHEILYPLMQGQDSLAISADIEMGGTDQLFNCLVGRSLQEAEGKNGQAVMSMPLLVGLDGTEKMSKSKNNIIGLTDEPNDMYGKAMSIPDASLPDYLDLVTDFSLPEISEMKKRLSDENMNPMEIKKAIAHNIVKQYHGSTQADMAANYFYNQFQNKNDLNKLYQEVSATEIFDKKTSMSLLDICSKLQPYISKAQIKRLVTSGAVSVDGEKESAPLKELELPCGNSINIRIGKMGYFAITARRADC